MKIVIAGATGLVGSVMLKVLEASRIFRDVELIPAASERSAGKKVSFNGREWNIRTMDEALRSEPDIAIFSAGAEVSRRWAPEFAAAKCFVIDNSSAWRKEKHIPLVVPEINANTIRKDTYIIANPNCSTIQMVLALYPLHRRYGLRRLVISTYQSVTGSGKKAVDQLVNERKGREGDKAYPHRIDKNLLPHGGVFLENGYTSEEQKLVDETRKILDDDDIAITATVVRVPVFGGHSEAVNAELKQDFEIADIRKLLQETPGLVVQDDGENNIYPMPLEAEGKDEVFVGRIRRDLSLDKALNLWIVSDNLRKGAATNAVQIAEYLITKKLL